VSRILKAYRTRYYQLLRGVGARDPQKGADWFVARAERASVERHIPLSAALTHSFEELAARPIFRLKQLRSIRAPADIRFFCDAGVGGLARWLRAAGYDVLWEPHIADEALLKRARESGATIITTDSMLMERRLLRDQVIPSFWLPPTLSIAEQLERVFREFNLCVGAPRCMRCGGELVSADKEALQTRIPPRTYRWLDDYFVCARCGKVFWHGTHWSRIRNKLEGLKKCLPGADQTGANTPPLVVSEKQDRNRSPSAGEPA
jgi:hypothetical protein